MNGKTAKLLRRVNTALSVQAKQPVLRSALTKLKRHWNSRPRPSRDRMRAELQRVAPWRPSGVE